VSEPTNINVSGSGHITAGRSITIFSGNDTLEALKAKLVELDAFLSSQLGEVVSSRTNTVVPFSSDKIISSLVALDIAPYAAHKVVFELQKYIQRPTGVDRTTTNAIRMAVARAIFNIDFGPELNGKRDEWAKRYARRYGNPDQLLLVIHRDGQHEPLDYKYIKQQLVPHVLRRIWEVNDVSKFIGWLISQQAIAEMAESILNEVKRLDVYSIRYKTLLYIAEDIALQPPHPWLVSPLSQERTVAYDFERIKVHLTRLEGGESEESKWQAVGECIHHSCSGILALYGYFLGSRYLSTLSNLKAAIDMNLENAPLWGFCEIRNIEADLLAAQTSVSTLSQLLKKTEKMLAVRSSENLKAVSKLGIELADAALRLRATIERRKRIFSQLATEENLTDHSLLNIAKELLMGINSIKEHKSFGEQGMVMLHQRSTAPIFQRIQPLILLAGSGSPASKDAALSKADMAIDLMRAHFRTCNTVVFVHSDTIGDDIKSHIRNSLTRDEFCILISQSALRALAEAPDKRAMFEEIFVSNVA
jgi:hypothetical protein